MTRRSYNAAWQRIRDRVLRLPCHYDVHSGNDTRGFRYSQRPSPAPETSVTGYPAPPQGLQATEPRR